jgi:hypothetical protein
VGESPPYTTWEKFAREACLLDAVFDTRCERVEVDEFWCGNDHFEPWVLEGKGPTTQDDRLGLTNGPGAGIDEETVLFAPPGDLEIPGSEDAFLVVSSGIFP